MRLCIFEDREVQLLEPLTLTRPAFELRCGAYTLFERQRAYFAVDRVSVLVRPTLVDLCRLAHPDVVVNDTAETAEFTAFVNARWLPPAGSPLSIVHPQIGLAGDQVAYAVVPGQQCFSHDAITDKLETWRTQYPAVAAGGAMIDYLWDLVERNAETLCQDFAPRTVRNTALPPGVNVVGPPEQLIVDPSATVEPFVLANTTDGPVVIDRNAVVQAFTRLEGPCYIGPGTWVVTAHVGGSTIGPMCRIGGEVEASIVQGFSNKYHEGFLGHSYLGEWVNLAAGTQTSDLRNDYGRISVTIQGRKVDTGLTKIGSFIGDHSKTGLNALLNTGSVIGAFCNLLPTGSLLPRVIPSFCQYHRGHIQPRSDWREMLTTAAKVMQRRGQELTSAHSDLFITLFDQTASQRKLALRDGDPRRWRQSM